MFAFGRSFARAGCVALVASLALGVVGCKSSSSANNDTLPPNQRATLMEADRLINDGEDLKSQGMKLRADGKSGDDLIKQGEQKIMEGENLKAKGMMMKQ